MQDRDNFLAHIWKTYESGDLLRACAWCGRIEIDGQWVAPPPGALSTIDEPVTLSHSICPDCAATQPAARHS